jgi:hypothetical protein
MRILRRRIRSGRSPAQSSDVQGSFDSAVNLIDIALADNGAQQACLTVEIDQRLGLLAIDGQSVGNGFLIVISALDKLTARREACIEIFLWREIDIQEFAGLRTGASAGEPFHEYVEVDIEQNSRIETLADIIENGPKRSGLIQIPGESIQDKSARAIRLGQTFRDDAQHDLITDEFTGIHGRLGPLAEIGTRLHSFAKQVPCGYLGQLEFRHQPLSLGSLTGPWRSQKNDSHLL